MSVVNALKILLSDPNHGRDIGDDRFSSPRASDLLIRRMKMIKEAGGILDQAEQETRGLDADENKRLKSIYSGIEKIDEQLEVVARSVAESRLEAARAIKAEFGAQQGNDGLILAPDQRMADLVPRDYPKADEITIGRYLRSMIMGPKNDAERRALSEGTDSAGGFTVPDFLSANFIDLMRKRQVAIQAGALTVKLDSDVTKIARLASDPTGSWRLENTLINDSDPTFEGVTFTARSLAILVKVSRELMQDSVNLDTALPEILTKAAALELDRAVLFGSGTAPEPRGVFNQTGIGSVSMGVNGAPLTNFDTLIDLVQTLQNANAADPTAFIMAPRTSTTIAKLKDTTNQPLTKPDLLAKTPFLVTTQVPITQTQGTATNASCVIAGDFSQVLIGIRSEIRIEILRERFAEYLQYAFLVHLRADVQLAQPAALAKLVGIIP